MATNKKRISDLPVRNPVANSDILIITAVNEVSYQANVQSLFGTFGGTGGGGTGTTFLDPPDLFEETATHFYMGWLDIGGSWLIRKQDRPTSLSTDATIIENNAYATLAAAWAARDTLVYV